MIRIKEYIMKFQKIILIIIIIIIIIIIFLTKIDAAKLSRKSSTSLFGAHTTFSAAGTNHG